LLAIGIAHRLRTLTHVCQEVYTMRLLEPVTDHEVCTYWRTLQNCPAHKELRGDILDSSYPSHTPWQKAVIEDADVPKMFMLSVPDFETLSNNTWMLPPAVEYYREHFAAGTYAPAESYHAEHMQKLLDYGAALDTRLIIVGESKDGPFAILDGNHRAILLLDQDRLVGTTIYAGIHPDIRTFGRMKQTERRIRALRQTGQYPA
jgi:hypothetical protein